MGEKELDKAIDRYKKPATQSLAPQQVIEAAKKVFSGEEGTWLSIGFVYFQLCKHPQRFGFESLLQMPLSKPFEKIIEHCGHFDTDRMKGQLLIRPKKETWPH